MPSFRDVRVLDNLSDNISQFTARNLLIDAGALDIIDAYVDVHPSADDVTILKETVVSIPANLRKAYLSPGMFDLLSDAEAARGGRWGRSEMSTLRDSIIAEVIGDALYRYYEVRLPTNTILPANQPAWFPLGPGFFTLEFECDLAIEHEVEVIVNVQKIYGTPEIGLSYLINGVNQGMVYSFGYSHITLNDNRLAQIALKDAVIPLLGDVEIQPVMWVKNGGVVIDGREAMNIIRVKRGGA